MKLLCYINFFVFDQGILFNQDFLLLLGPFSKWHEIEKSRFLLSHGFLKLEKLLILYSSLDIELSKSDQCSSLGTQCMGKSYRARIFSVIGHTWTPKCPFKTKRPYYTPILLVVKSYEKRLPDQFSCFNVFCIHTNLF